MLLGGRESITRFRPVMVVEFFKRSAKEFEGSLENLIDLLTSLGYSLHSQKNFKEYKNKKTLLNSIPSGDSTNILCIPKNGYGLKKEKGDCNKALEEKAVLLRGSYQDK